MTELALLARAFETVPDPGDATVFVARAGLLGLIAAVENGAAPRGLQEPQRRLVLLLPRTAPRFRLALILIALLLLLAGIATATYLGVRTWGGGPSTSQARSGYRLSVIFDLPPEKKAFYSGVTLGAGGHDLYAIHHRVGTEPHATELVRIRGIDTSTPSRPQRVLDFQDLAEPRLWNTGLDLRTDVIDDWPAPGAPRALPVVDSRGDIFLVAAARKPGAERPEGVSLIVLHPNGDRQKVLTPGELERSGVLRTGGNPVSLVAAATAPDRLWIIATVVDPSYRNPSLHALLEVVDPNADGNWSDRVVRRIGLPRSIPESTPRRNWEFPQLAVEPSRPGDDRSHSVLALVWSDEFRIYRIADRNGDGDALDPGEVRLVLDGVGAPKGSPTIAPRSVRVNGRLRRELIAVALERWDRVSLISSPTHVTDVVRSLPLGVGGGWTPLAGAGRDIYLVRSGDNRLAAYRLTPTGPVQQVAPIEPRASQTPLPPAAEHAQLLVTRYSRDGYHSFWMRADGTIVRRLAPKTSWQLCQSADGRELLYTSHAEAPGEEFLYVAQADGSARKVTEHPVDATCPFSTRWLLFTRQSTYTVHGALVRHDLEAGGEVEIAHDVDALSISPDGNRVVYAGGLDYSRGWPPTGHRTIELVDLRTLRHRRLAGPPLTLAQWPRFGGLAWSPDGSRVAYMTRPAKYGRHAGPPAQWPPRQTDLWVQRVGTGDRKRVLRIVGSPPSFSWSPDGKQLLVCTEARGTRTGCSGTHRRPQGNDARLLIVDLADGSSRIVARGKLVFAAWAPAGQELVYATTDALFLRTLDGRIRRVASAPSGGWPTWSFSWLGWSPDERYVGFLTERAGVARELSVLDVRTGGIRVIQHARKGESLTATWWQTKPKRGGSR